jgi:uncharacterized Zn ribbon protein
MTDPERACPNCGSWDEYTEDDDGYRTCWECGTRWTPGNDDRDEPTRSEPADFGGGESTGVQDL